MFEIHTQNNCTIRLHAAKVQIRRILLILWTQGRTKPSAIPWVNLLLKVHHGDRDNSEYASCSVNNQPLLECSRLPLLRSDVLLLEDGPSHRQQTVVLHHSRHKNSTRTLTAIPEVTNLFLTASTAV